MKMPENYEIANEIDAAYLRTCCGIRTPLKGEPAEFPLELKAVYFHVSTALQRLGSKNPNGMDATQLAMVYAIYKTQATEEPAEREIECPYESGDKVIAKIKGKEVEVDFAGVEKGKFLVKHDGTVRRLQPSSVLRAAEVLETA